MPVLLGILHGIDYLLTSLLLGSIAFLFWIAPAGGKEAQKVGSFLESRIRLLFALSCLSSFFWMFLSAQDMADSWEWSDLWMAMGHTDFGHWWCIRIIVLGAGWVLSRTFFDTTSEKTLIALSAVGAPLISSLTGHAAAQASPFGWRIGVDWAHFLAVGIWGGGLYALFSWLGARITLGDRVSHQASHRVIERFSRFAMTGTVIIGLTGLAMSYLANVPLLRPWNGGTYGKLVLSKIIFFGVALMAAAINQFLHLRTWRPDNEPQIAASIRREVGIELLLVIVILGLAGFLTRSALPGM